MDGVRGGGTASGEERVLAANAGDVTFADGLFDGDQAAFAVDGLTLESRKPAVVNAAREERSKHQAGSNRGRPPGPGGHGAPAGQDELDVPSRLN